MSDGLSRILIAPSILSADLGRLAEEARMLEEAGADWIHVDIMDGAFVPNLTFGPWIVKSLRAATRLPLDCHLMVSKPEDWIEKMIEAGASRVTVHVESTPHIHRALARIRELGAAPGISLNPGHGVAAVEGALDWVDTVQVMSVDPGFSGQHFLEGTLRTVRELKALRGNRKFLIEIDGGISAENAAEVREAGVDVIVAGSAVFGAADRRAAIAGIRKAADASSGKPLAEAAKRPSDVPVSIAEPESTLNKNHLPIALASDHAGYALKQSLLQFLKAQKIESLDLGTYGTAPVDYPDYAEKVGRAILAGKAERAILICGSGVGASVAAGKIPGIRAAVCHDYYSAHQGVEHDNMNVLVLGARVVGDQLAEDLVTGFLNAKFTGEARHVRRLAKVTALEKSACEGAFSSSLS